MKDFVHTYSMSYSLTHFSAPFWLTGYNRPWSYGVFKLFNRSKSNATRISSMKKVWKGQPPKQKTFSSIPFHLSMTSADSPSLVWVLMTLWGLNDVKGWLFLRGWCIGWVYIHIKINSQDGQSISNPDPV